MAVDMLTGELQAELRMMRARCHMEIPQGSTAWKTSKEIEPEAAQVTQHSFNLLNEARPNAVQENELSRTSALHGSGVQHLAL